MTEDYEVIFDYERQRVKYAESRRWLFVQLDYTDGWVLRPETIRWWECGDGSRRPVNDAERKMIIDRVSQPVRERSGWPVNVVGCSAETAGETIETEAEIAVSGTAALDDSALLAKIERALAWLAPMEAQNWDVAQSISRQLRWCSSAVKGESVEAPPGPFSMGLMATREFDMYGSDPGAARLINEIQDEMTRRGYPR